MDILSSTAVTYRAVTHVFTLIFYVLLAKITASQRCAVCSAGWQQWEQSCYRSLYPLKSNWQGALESCQDLGANLPTPNSIEEYDFIWSTFWVLLRYPDGVWIGCTDEDGDKVWECNGDTKDVKYRAEWYRAIGDDERCAIMSTQYPRWNSWNCAMEMKYVMCERQVPKDTASQSCSFCPAGWQEWGESCYKKGYPLIINWQGALESCQDLGANLATPNSREEYDFIWSTFWAWTPDGVWIGCTDEDGDEVWECNGDTKDVKYRAEWNSAIGDNEKCAVMSTQYPHWNSWNCNVERYVMCERPVPIMTKTATCSIVATDRCLLDHTFKTLTVRGKLQCCLACHKDQRCSSFNLRGNQCELINTTDAEDHLSTAVSCKQYTL